MGEDHARAIETRRHVPSVPADRDRLIAQRGRPGNPRRHMRTRPRRSARETRRPHTEADTDEGRHQVAERHAGRREKTTGRGHFPCRRGESRDRRMREMRSEEHPRQSARQAHGDNCRSQNIAGGDNRKDHRGRTAGKEDSRGTRPLRPARNRQRQPARLW